MTDKLLDVPDVRFFLNKALNSHRRTIIMQEGILGQDVGNKVK